MASGFGQVVVVLLGNADKSHIQALIACMVGQLEWHGVAIAHHCHCRLVDRGMGMEAEPIKIFFECAVTTHYFVGLFEQWGDPSTGGE